MSSDLLCSDVTEFVTERMHTVCWILFCV